MSGWRRSARTAASRSNRAISVSSAPRRNLTATGAPSTRSNARKTTPIPPDPAGLSSSKRSSMVLPGVKRAQFYQAASLIFDKPLRAYSFYHRQLGAPAARASAVRVRVCSSRLRESPCRKGRRSMATIEKLCGSGVYDPPFYSQAIKVTGASTLLFLSGQVSYDTGGGVLHRGDFKAQARECFRALKAHVEAAGGELDNIVKLTTYLTDIRYCFDLMSVC